MEAKKHILRRPVFWTGCGLLLLMCIPAAYLIYGQIAKRDFNEHVEKLKKLGESLEFEDFKPKPVEDDSQNFAEAPIVRSIRGLEGTDAGSENKVVYQIDPPTINEMDGYATGAKQDVRYLRQARLNRDFPRLSEAEAALAIVSHFEPNDTELAALAEAARRPDSNFELEYESGFALALPHISAVQSFARAYNDRSQAFFLTGRIDRSAEDIATLLHLAIHTSNEPIIINQLVSITFLDMAIGGILAGLSEQKWKQHHLSRFDAIVQKIDIASGFLRGFRMERAIYKETVLDTSRRREVIEMSGRTELLPFLILIPEGWYYDNVRYYSEAFQEGILTDSHGRVLTDDLPIDFLRHSASRTTSGRFINDIRYGLASISMPVVGSILPRFQRTQTYLDHARIALALEEIRLSEGTYPDSLEELTDRLGGSVPFDMFTDAPYVYETLNDGTYQLYGVGSNQIDDGGQMKYVLEQGDWVWRLTLPEDFDYDEYRSRD